MGYSLCMMTNFQNALISRIFSVFWSGFFAQNKYKQEKMRGQRGTLRALAGICHVHESYF